MLLVRIFAYFLASGLFIMGLIASKGFVLYFTEEGHYVRDTLVLDGTGSFYSAGKGYGLYRGYFKSDQHRTGIKCRTIDSLLGSSEDVYELSRALNKKETTRDVALYRHVPKGTAHVYNADKNKYYPGDSGNIKLFSISTYLMLPLVFLLLTRQIRLRWQKRRQNTLPVWLLMLFVFDWTGLRAQSASDGDTLYTFNIEYVSKQTIDMDVVRYEELALKKTTFDTTRFRLQYPEECLLCEISATDEATLKYCHENDDIQKNPNHFTSIARMSPDDLYLQPTLKLVQYFPADTFAWVKLYFVDNIRGRKIRAVKQMEWSEGRWQLSAEKLDADLAFAISGIRDEVLEAIFLRRYPEDHELFAMQEACFSSGVFNLRALSKAYQSWFVKGKEQTAIIEKYGENLIQ